MKKVCYQSSGRQLANSVLNSSLASPLSEVLRNEYISQLAQALMMPISSFLQMKALQIAALLIVEWPGLFVVERLPGKRSFVVARGECSKTIGLELELIIFFILGTLYYLHSLSKKVSSIVTSSRVLSTQPASIRSSSVPSTICNPFQPPTQLL